MDENSFKGETSDGEKPETSDAPDRPKQKEEVSSFFQKENVKVRLDFGNAPNTSEVSGRVGSSIEVSAGPSNYIPPSLSGPSVSSPPLEPKSVNKEKPLKCEESSTATIEETETELRTTQEIPVQLSNYDAVREYQPPVQIGETTQVQPTTRNSLGPPPSYSFVMKQKRKFSKLLTDPVISNRPPPPSYGGMRGLYISPEDDRMCNLPSFSEPIWRSHSQPALCPRCGILILTTTHSHDSVATHVAALTLCLFGCWPCCLLPYCMNVCKNTYHHCPICQTYLGVHTPW